MSHGGPHARLRQVMNPAALVHNVQDWSCLITTVVVSARSSVGPESVGLV